jgi:alkanesulfonate monooxygenase SsuD/methylene tetrahydromethanopterin reductase-like flavin-dependent oxidoreductase (luciferase family)
LLVIGGIRFATQHADLAFTLLNPDPDSWAPQIETYHRLARDEFRRSIQVWTRAYVAIGETDREAEDYVASYAVDRTDHAWVGPKRLRRAAIWVRIGFVFRTISVEIMDKIGFVLQILRVVLKFRTRNPRRRGSIAARRRGLRGLWLADARPMDSRVRGNDE